MNSGYSFKLNGIPIKRFIVRRNRLKRGWPTQEESLVVSDPILGEITVDDKQVTDIYGDKCSDFILEMRPRNISPKDKSWLVNSGWVYVTVEEAIAILIMIDDKSSRVQQDKV